jgi:hypothetical protein
MVMLLGTEEKKHVPPVMALMRRANWSYAAVEAAVRPGIVFRSCHHGGLGVSTREAVAFGR